MKKAQFSSLVFFVIFICSLVLFCGCSKTDDKDGTISRKNDSQSPEYEQSLEIEDTNGDMDDKTAEDEDTDIDGIRDEGTPCKKHRYVLPAGSSETLTFSRIYPVKEEETSSFEMYEDGLEKYGINISFISANYDTFEVSYPVWALDGTEMFESVKEDPSYKKERQRGDIPYLIPIKHVITNIIKIRWRNDGYAIITSLNGISGKEKIGKLTEDELTNKLNPGGFQPMVVYSVKSQRKTFELYATQITEEKEIKIQTYDMSVIVPESRNKLETSGRSVAFIPVDGWNTGIGVHVASSWGRKPDLNRMFFIVSGPRVSSDCFE